MASGAQMNSGFQRMRANRKVVEASCLTCGAGFTFGEEVFVCAVCGKYHHARCWDASAGCRHHSVPSATSTPGISASPALSSAELIGAVPATPSAEVVKSKECPNCRLVNPGSAIRCDCGYDFNLGKVQPPPLSAGADPVISEASGREMSPGTALAGDEQYCPQCREIIKSAALKCRFCGHILSAQLSSQEVPNYVVSEVLSQASSALWFGIIGIFICGPVLGSIAISKGNKAIATMDQYPLYPWPRGKAQTGRVLGWIAWAFVAIYVISKIANTK